VALGGVRCTRVSDRRVELAVGEEGYLRGHWGLLRGLRSALRTEPNVRFAAVFGSVARGDAREGSDVDLLVDLADSSWTRHQPLNTRLERQFDRSVELVLLARVREENPSLLVDVLREGRVLVDRDGVWSELRRQEPSLRRVAQADQTRRANEARAAVDELTAP